jgi:hypothetical protein
MNQHDPAAAPKLETRFSRVGRWLTSGWSGRIVTSLFLLLSFVVIGLMLANHWETVAALEWRIRPVWLLYIALFFAIDLLVATWAWHLLVARLANYRNFRQSAKICWRANLARRIPTPVWYIANRALLYEQVGVSKTTTSLLSSLELVFFLLSGLATTLLTLPFWAIPAEFMADYNPLLWLALLAPFSLLFVHPRLLEKVWRRIRPDIALEPLRWRDTISWLFYYILAWLFGALVLFSAINLLYPVPINQIIVVVGVWSLAGSVSLAGALTVSLIGVREISLLLLLTIIVPAPIAVIAAILIRLIWIVGETVGAIVSLKL